LNKNIAVVILAFLVLSMIPTFTMQNAKADASEAKVLNDYSFYVASSPGFLAANAGDLVVVGEIQNVGSAFIQNVTLSATALDSNGTTLGTSQGIAFVYETPPGQKAPFVIDFSPASTWSSQVASVTITVLSVTDATAPPYTGVHFTDTPTQFNDSGTYTAVGTIINNGSQTVGDVWVVTTFYNNAGTVVGLNFTEFLTTPYAPLSPGGAARYLATPADNTLQLTNEITSAAYIIDSIPLSTSNTQTPSTSSASNGGSPSSFPWLPVIVVIVIVVAAVMALILLRKRPETQPPPPPPPPPESLEPNS